MMKKILAMCGLAPSQDDMRLRDLVNNSYRSVRVVGRGTVMIDPAEVTASPEFTAARQQAAAIVQSQRSR